VSDAAGAALVLEGRAALAAALQSAAEAAQRELLLLCFDFDRGLYGSEGFADAVKRLALSGERARIRVLINQPKAAMRGAHRLVELGRRLPSRIEFRELDEEQQIAQRGDWLIADQRRLVERSAPDALVARALDDAPLAAQARARAFGELWDRSPGCAEFRVLGL